MSIDTFNLFLGVMSLIALFVFIALYFVKAGYGIFRTASWGVAISNKLAWILMEAPVFVVMCVMWIYSERRFEPVIFTFFLFFQIHYFQPVTMYRKQSLTTFANYFNLMLYRTTNLLKKMAVYQKKV